jgi:NADH-quinone oxidoreductase subunit N
MDLSTATIAACDFRWLAPEIVLTIGALVVLLVGAFVRGGGGTVSCVLTLITSLVALYFSKGLWGADVSLFSGLYVIDGFGTFFKVVILVILALVTIISRRYMEREGQPAGEYYSLMSLGALGMMCMVSSNHFITIFIGLEVMSLAIYVLCGLFREHIRSVEASLKYFLLGAFATAFLLYGMALTYGSTGLLDIVKIGAFVQVAGFKASPILLMGMAFLIIGFGFKIASVPFHMWTPDVYEGAPTSITAFMATGVKLAAFAAFLRVFYTAFYSFIPEWSVVLWFLAVLTMTVGNVVALVQTNLKRLLAYSSIAHAGYLLVAFITGDKILSSSILFYLLAYAFMNIGAFTVIILLGRKGEENEEIENYAGLAVRHPFIALCMSIFLLSLTGIPPLAGFMGKFYVFSAAVKSHFYWLAIIGVLNSAVAAFYYLRVLMYMYFRDPMKDIGRIDMAPGYILVMLISVAALIYIGIFPREFLLMAEKSVLIFQ